MGTIKNNEGNYGIPTPKPWLRLVLRNSLVAKQMGSHYWLWVAKKNAKYISALFMKAEMYKSFKKHFLYFLC